MSFDGGVESLIDSWAEGSLKRRREGSIRVDADFSGNCHVLYSYDEPVASLWVGEPERYAVIGTQFSLERTSITTNKHLRWVERSVRSLPYLPRTRLVQGRVPTEDLNWGPFLNFFRVVHAENLSPQVKQLWRERQRVPNDDGVRNVLWDVYMENGFGSPLPEHGSIFLNTRGFVIGNRHGADIIVEL